MAINYLRRVQALRQNQGQSDVQRGLQAGQEIGKLLGGLGTAIKGAQKDALANKLMNTEDAPRAALVDPGDSSGGGPQPGGPQPAAGDPSDDDLRRAMAADSLSKPSGTPQDLGTLPDPSNPQPTMGINTDINNPQPSMGINPDIAPTSTDYTPTAADDTAFAKAIAAARVGSGPTVGSTIPAAPAAITTGAVAPAPRQNVIAPGVSTAGTAPHTGGVQEMDLRKEMLAQQLQKQNAALASQKNALDLADRQAEASGTGRYALDAAKKRADLAKTQLEIANYGKTKPDKNPPAVNIASEPVIDQNQLVQHFEGTYGKGSFADVMNNLDQVDTKTSPGFAIIGPPDKPVAKIPIGDAQTFVKQQNALRIKQGLSPFRVPGEESDYQGNMVGATAANPYPAQNNLDVYSRAPGTWVRLPNGKIAQVPQRR